MTKLHLGCGTTYLDGYVNIDYPESEHNHIKPICDRYEDITKLSFEEGSIDEIRLHHVFEHFGRVQALALLIKWHLWLKVGGKLRIEVPDLTGCAEDILWGDSKTRMAAIRHMVGDQTARWGYHIEQWNDDRLLSTLKAIGFGGITTRRWRWDREPYLANVEAIGIKERTIPKEEMIESAKELLRESTVSESEGFLWRIWCEQLGELC